VTTPRVVIQDYAGERYVLFAHGRAHRLETATWRDIRWIEELCSGTVGEWHEIVTDEEGAVEILARQECADCDGTGKVPTYRGYIRGNETDPDDLWIGSATCDECAGEGQLYTYQFPARSAYLADLARPERAA